MQIAWEIDPKNFFMKLKAHNHQIYHFGICDSEYVNHCGNDILPNKVHGYTFPYICRDCKWIVKSFIHVAKLVGTTQYTVLDKPTHSSYILDQQTYLWNVSIVFPKLKCQQAWKYEPPLLVVLFLPLTHTYAQIVEQLSVEIIISLTISI